MIANAMQVLAGTKTWVGYSGARSKQLPAIKPGVLPPYNILPQFVPGEELERELNLEYATQYSAGTDIGLMLNNLKYLGRK